VFRQRGLDPLELEPFAGGDSRLDVRELFHHLGRTPS